MIPVPGVYMIRDDVARRAYIGSSQNVERRCKEHLARLQSGTHPNHALQQDWLKHGPAGFTFTLLEPTALENKRLSHRELEWQERLRTIGLQLYGIRDGGRKTWDRRVPGLRRLRTLAALSQGELAERAGVQRQTINRLENGGEAEMPTVRKLAAALDVQPRELILEEPHHT